MTLSANHWIRSSEPWENHELEAVITDLRKAPQIADLQEQIRDKRKYLKDLYIHEKAKPSSKITISKEKLTKHYIKHFTERVFEMPSELKYPECFAHLKDIVVEVNEGTSEYDEIVETVKSSGADKLHSEKFLNTILVRISPNDDFPYLATTNSSEILAWNEDDVSLHETSTFIFYFYFYNLLFRL